MDNQNAKRGLSLVLSLLMVVSSINFSLVANAADANAARIVGFNALEEDLAVQELPVGASLDDVKFPSTLKATVESVEEVEVQKAVEEESKEGDPVEEEPAEAEPADPAEEEVTTEPAETEPAETVDDIDEAVQEPESDTEDETNETPAEEPETPAEQKEATPEEPASTDKDSESVDTSFIDIIFPAIVAQAEEAEEEPVEEPAEETEKKAVQKEVTVEVTEWKTTDGKAFDSSTEASFVYEPVLKTDYAVASALPTIKVNIVNTKSKAAFEKSQVVDGVRVTVKADAGVFPEGATLSVAKVSGSEEQAVEAAVDEKRDDNKNKVEAYTFDIKVLDKDGNEIEPDNSKGKVKVSFTLEEVANENLETDVYHIKGEVGSLSVDELNAEEVGDTTVEATTDGFSYYTVEFTYNNLQYVMNGGQTVEISEILNTVGLSGNVETVVSSNPELFEVNKDEEWTVTANRTFSTNETLKVKLDGVEYVIVVTATVTYLDWDETQNKLVKKNCTESYEVLAGDKERQLGESGQTRWYVVQDAASTGTRDATIEGDVRLIICDGAHLRLNCFSMLNDYSSLIIKPGASLTVYGQEQRTGHISIATNKSEVINIQESGSLTINGINIVIDGSNYTNRIYVGKNANFTLNAGSVSACGTSGANTQGMYVHGGHVIVNGGKLTATASSDSSYGIEFAENSEVVPSMVVNGGTVEAITPGTAGASNAGINDFTKVRVSDTLTTFESDSLIEDVTAATVTEVGGASPTKRCITITKKPVTETIIIDGQEYSPWNYSDRLPSTYDKVYLTSDVTMTSDWVIDRPAGPKICLLGHTIDMGENQIIINDGNSTSSLIVCDADTTGNLKNNGGKIIGTTPNYIRVGANGTGVFTLVYGTIEGPEPILVNWATSDVSIYNGSVISTAGAAIKIGDVSSVCNIKIYGTSLISGKTTAIIGTGSSKITISTGHYDGHLYTEDPEIKSDGEYAINIAGDVQIGKGKYTGKIKATDGTITGGYFKQAPDSAYVKEFSGNKYKVETKASYGEPEWAYDDYGYRVVTSYYTPLTDETPVTIYKGSDPLTTNPAVGDVLTVRCDATDITYEIIVDGVSRGTTTDATASYQVRPEDAGKQITVKVTQIKKEDGSAYGADAPIKSATTATVVKKAIVPDGEVTATTTYGDALASAQITGTMKCGSTTVAGSFAWASDVDTRQILGVGSHILNAVFTPTDTASYDPVTVEVQLGVNPKALSVKADDYNLVEGATVHELTYTVTGLVGADDASEIFTGLLACTIAVDAPVGTTAQIDIGTLALKSAVRNYTFNSSGFTPGTLTVVAPTLVAVSVQCVDITPTSATLCGSVSPVHYANATYVDEVGFEYRKVGEAVWTDIECTLNADGSFTANLSNLSEDTVYEYRPFIIQKEHTEKTYGEAVAFHTIKPASVDTGKIAVTVQRDDPTIADSRIVIVSVEEGNEAIASKNLGQLQAEPIEYAFDNLPAGNYNVVCRTLDGDYTETKMLSVKNGEATNVSFAVLQGKLSTVVEVVGDSPKAAVNGLANILSPEDKAYAANGSKDIQVKLTVEQKSDDSATEGVTEIKSLLTPSQQVDTVLDMSLWKSVTNLDEFGNATTGTKTTNIGGINDTVLEIAIPFRNIGNKLLSMFRFHNDTAEVLKNDESKRDGTFFYDALTQFIHLFSSGFSTYAIATEDATVPSSGGSGNSSSDGQVKTIPVYRLYNTKIGDHLYTTNKGERDILLTEKAAEGWTDEGIAWQAAVKSDKPVYRLFDVKGKAGHFFTADITIRDQYIANGWRDEGIAWYATYTGRKVYKITNHKIGKYHFTTSKPERDVLETKGYTCEEAEFTVY